MTRRDVAIGLMALMAWTALVSAGSTGIVAMIAMDRFVAAPNGALALCEIVTRETPR